MLLPFAPLNAKWVHPLWLKASIHLGHFIAAFIFCQLNDLEVLAYFKLFKLQDDLNAMSEDSWRV